MKDKIICSDCRKDRCTTEVQAIFCKEIKCSCGKSIGYRKLTKKEFLKR